MLTPVRAAVTAATAISLATAGACSDERSPPSRLADGTAARTVPIAFEGVTGAVLATVTRVGPPRGGCGAARGKGVRAVERVSVAGTSVTLVAPGVLHACDGMRRGEWCGHAFARRSARVFDPRLSITCRDASGSPVGFGWVAPRADADFVVVEHEGYSEAFRAAGDAPIRVTASAVDIATSSARFELTEHTADGRLLRARSVAAQVSG